MNLLVSEKEKKIKLKKSYLLFVKEIIYDSGYM